MNYRSGVLTGVVATLLLAGAAGAGWWMLHAKPGEAAKPAPPPAPVSVPRPFKEDQAAGITLTPEAEGRIAIRTGPVERKAVNPVRTYGGEVTVPPGRSVIVSAPLAGILKPAEGVVPVAGLDVKKGQAIFQLLPLLDPVGRANLTTAKVDAEGQVKNAEEQLRAVQIALDRAKKVLAGGAGSQRMVDEAQAQVDLAAKTLEAAMSRRNLLNKVVGQVEAGTTTPVPVEAPQKGVLRNVSALPEQTVPAGAALFEVVNLEHVWVRVPVYVGDLPAIDPTAPAAIGNLAARPGDPTRPATPVSAPPTANPTAGTADLFYALDNRESRYSPGQRVGATLPLKGSAEDLTVPWSAVVYDIHGGAWVYEKTGAHGYTRRRVVVQSVVGADAVLASGPPPGTPVVTAGAAELFGAETGFSK
jgi:RND family efflux transporter MFP subunit